MKKFYLTLLIIFFICYNSYCKSFNDGILKNIQIKENLNFSNITLENIFNLISEESDIDFILDENIKNLGCNIDFKKNKNFEDIVNSIIIENKLEIIGINNQYIITQANFKENKFIYGRVVDSNSNMGVPNVKLTIKNSKNSYTYSDNLGFFVFNNIDEEVGIIKLEKNGFETTGDIINIENNKNYYFKIKKISSQQSSLQNTEYLILNEENILYETEINNISIHELKNIISNVFENKVNFSSLDNKIIISGERNLVLVAKKLIDSLNYEKKQIRVTAQIFDISNNLFESLGFNWIYGNNKEELSNDTNISFLNTVGINGFGNTYSSGIKIARQFNSGNDILNLGINLLESTQDLVVSAKPTILVLDGKEGSFRITEEVIVGQKSVENDKNDKTTTTPLFKEAGIILKVIPSIYEKEIFLDLNIEVSNFKLSINKENGNGTFNADGGSKVGRNIKTTIKLSDGESVLIGGLKRATIYKLNSKVPFFGTLPMINSLFKNQATKYEISDVYIKLKVDIVNSGNEDLFIDETLYYDTKKINSNKIYN